MESTKYYLGLDVGGTNMVAGVVDENHQIIAKESIPTVSYTHLTLPTKLEVLGGGGGGGV